MKHTTAFDTRSEILEDHRWMLLDSMGFRLPHWVTRGSVTTTTNYATFQFLGAVGEMEDWMEVRIKL